MTNYQEDPLESLLDSESDDAFGQPTFKEQTQVLAHWKAQDFSDIYVRFYPHLLRHAKRFLRNHSQAEEVVQDAFLYLMTSLPEVDSELGVLKLLKWKVRNLALDVIKSESRTSFSTVQDVDLPVEHELSENLIRADEAAIVSMALARLNPRQRQAIVASLYQGKDTAAVAKDLALSENATRQLLFRAKSAFKKALVGEAETAGLTVAQILSIAAKKAARESGRYISAASVLLLVIALATTTFQTPTNNQPIAQEKREQVEEFDQAPYPLEVQEIEQTERRPLSTASSQSETSSVDIVELASTLPSLPLEVSGRLSLGASKAGFAYVFGSDRDQLIRPLAIFTDDSLVAHVELVRVGETYIYELKKPTAELTIAGVPLSIVSNSFASSQSMAEDGQVLTLVAADLRLVTPSGDEYLEQPLSESSMTVQIKLDILGQVTFASVFLN